MLSTFPRWKYVVLAVALVVGLIYSLPNLYGEDPAVQIIAPGNAKVDKALEEKVVGILNSKQIKYKSISLDNDQLLVRFFSADVQISSRDIIKNSLGQDYSVALNLAPVTPAWLRIFGAEPMKLGLDLRGGVRFLMEVDLTSNIQRRLESNFNDLRSGFRENKIRYSSMRMGTDNSMSVNFESDKDKQQGSAYISRHFPNLEYVPSPQEANGILISLPQLHIDEIRNNIMEQTISTLRNRVNELGVAEAIIQRQGANRVVVELPGIQDTARAKDILGRTATLDFLLEDADNDIMQALQGKVPPGSKVYFLPGGQPVLLKTRVILTGDSIDGASSQFDSQDGKPIVKVDLGGGGIGLFKETTLHNIGKHMAVIYRETHMQDVTIDGKTTKQPVNSERIISYARINDALGSGFQISGMPLNETRDLALLLRAGALPATVSIVEERIIGPSMGQENIDKGITSVIVGFSAVVIFMAFYYSLFGIIADLALFFNLVLLLALLSLVGATLTLPGIAGIVLTLGMAVDANVLIFERIREEIRNGVAPHTSIQRGFDHAFATIIDSNLTTLIVGIILFSVGTGPVKGFAVTLSLGILTSMFTSITGTRALVEIFYGKRNIKTLAIGI